MTNGLNFDFDDYRKWKQEKAEKLHDLVVSGFLSTMEQSSSSDWIIHDIFRQLLLSAGHTEETLTLFEDIYRGRNHAS